MTNWLCLECETEFEASAFSSEDVECPHCGARWSEIREIQYNPDDYDNDYSIIW